MLNCEITIFRYLSHNLNFSFIILFVIELLQFQTSIDTVIANKKHWLTNIGYYMHNIALPQNFKMISTSITVDLG